MCWEFLNQNSGAFAAIFSLVVAIATLVYAFLTWRLVSETRKMREAQTEPNISITIQPREDMISFIDMIVKNVGLGTAHNIKFKVDPDFKYFTGEFLSELGFIKNGLNYLAPNQKLEFFLTSMLERPKEKIKEAFEIKVTYQNSIGKTYESLFLINFSHLVGLSQLGKPDLKEIAENIEKVQKEIRDLSTQLKK